MAPTSWGLVPTLGRARRAPAWLTGGDRPARCVQRQAAFPSAACWQHRWPPVFSRRPRSFCVPPTPPGLPAGCERLDQCGPWAVRHALPVRKPSNGRGTGSRRPRV